MLLVGTGPCANEGSLRAATGDLTSEGKQGWPYMLEGPY